MNCFIMSHGIISATGVSVMGMNVTFCFAWYNFTTCGFASEVVNMNRVIQQYIHRAVSVLFDRLYQFIRDLIRCWDWYGLDIECI